MFYLFTSDAQLRYIRDALNTLAYPRDYVIRFRYYYKHVAEAVIAKSDNRDGPVNIAKLSRRALITYAETATTADGKKDPTQPFIFYPLREAEIIGIQRSGSSFNVDVSLKGYVSYGRTDETLAGEHTALDGLRSKITSLPRYPLPKPAAGRGLMWRDGSVQPFVPGHHGGTGYFLNYKADAPKVNPPAYTADKPTEHQAWESVVNILADSKAMEGALHFRICGLCVPTLRTFRLGQYKDVPIKPSRKGLEVQYDLPLGEIAILKIATYSARDLPEGKEIKICIKTDGEGFAGLSPSEIAVDSRYNEQRVVLACKRVLDNVLSPITCQTSDQTGLSPTVFLLTRVNVPPQVPATIFVFFVLGAVLLSLGPEFFNQAVTLGGWTACSTQKAVWAKILGGLLTAYAFYKAFRKLPVGK